MKCFHAGFGSFLCGNPLQAVRARTQKQMVSLVIQIPSSTPRIQFDSLEKIYFKALSHFSSVSSRKSHICNSLTSQFISYLSCAQVQKSRSQTRPSTQLGSYIPERMYDDEQPSSQDRSDVFAELRNWRIEHNKY